MTHFRLLRYNSVTVSDAIQKGFLTEEMSCQVVRSLRNPALTGKSLGRVLWRQR